MAHHIKLSIYNISIHSAWEKNTIVHHGSDLTLQSQLTLSKQF